MWGFCTMNIKCIKAKLCAAFSLIELMVVIAIVALLTAVAVPAYQGYLQQSKVAEIFSLASEQMNRWGQEYNLGTDGFPITTSSLGSYIATSQLNNEVDTPTVTDCPIGGDADVTGLGVICMQLVADTGIDALLNDLVIYYTPYEAGSSSDSANTTIAWTCKFVATGDTDDDATVETILSPGSCTTDA